MNDTHQEIKIMQTQINSKYGLQKIGSYLFNFGALTGVATLIFGLISCGGGGGGGTSGSGSTALTISSITPPGMVASSVFQTITIAGTNFASGVTVTITNSSGVPVVSSVSVATTLITAQVKIDTTPTNRYVMVSIQPPSSGTAVTHVLGVAGARKTFATNIHSIFAQPASAASCTGCHTGTSNGGLDLVSANNLNKEPSMGCSTRFRVTPGDPRRSSSVLIDKIQVTPTGISACNGYKPMPPSSPTLSTQEIQDIIDWVAGGAL